MLERCKLGSAAQARLEDLRRKHPKWELKEDQSDEFVFWMDSGEDEFVPTPSSREELVEWLTKHPKTAEWSVDDWRERCRHDLPSVVFALKALAQEGTWLFDRWRVALQMWAGAESLQSSWREISDVLIEAPDDFLREVRHSLSWWLHEQGGTLEGHDETFLALSQRILSTEFPDVDSSSVDPVFRAINHPVGQVTEGLLYWWYRQSPSQGGGLPEALRGIFTDLCTGKTTISRYGRVILATHVVPLFRADECWAKEFLLPGFDWKQSESEASAMWRGFMGSCHPYPPFLAEIKEPLLMTSKHVEKLGEYGEQYVSFLTFEALDRRDIFSGQELAGATRSLPEEALPCAADAVARALESAGDQRGEYWQNRALPYFETIWPGSAAPPAVSGVIAKSLAAVCIAAGDAFPQALRCLGHWLGPLDDPHRIVWGLHDSELGKRFPGEVLEFLDKLIGEGTPVYDDRISECLAWIVEANPTLREDHRYRRLADMLR